MRRWVAGLMLAFAGCSAPAPRPTPTPSPSPRPTPIVIPVASPSPSPVDQDYKPFKDPDNRPHPESERSYDVKHYRIEIKIDDAKPEIEATTTITLSPLKENLVEIELDAADMTFKRVAVVAESGVRASQFGVKPGRLIVPLDRPLKTSETVQVAVEYVAQPTAGFYRITPDEAHPNKPWMVWTQGETEFNHHWFPCWDKPNDKATSEIIATVRSPHIAISNGAMVNRKDAGDWSTFHWKQEQAHSAYLVSLVVGDFDRSTESVSVGGTFVPLDVYTPKGMYKAGDVARTFAKTADMVTFFSSKTGVDYPWAKYAQVLVLDFIWGGMENTSATTLHPYAVVPERASMDRDTDGLISHELAHQWFGDLVTCRTWSETWLNEGFATYATTLWEESVEGAARREEGMYGQHQGVLDEMETRYARPIVTDRYTDPLDMFDGHSYGKGACVLNMLRAVVGDEAWWNGVGLYLKRNRGECVTTVDLQKAMESASGRNLDVFFDQWLFKGGAPHFSVQTTFDEEFGTLKLVAEQVQVTDEHLPIFRVPVEIDITTASGRKSYRVQVEQKRHEFVFALDGRPLMLEFDPRARLLHRLTWAKGLEELLAIAQQGSTVSRLWAIRQLAKLRDPQIAPALRRLIVEEGRLSVQQAAAEALGEVDAELLAAVALKTGIKDAKLRATVYKAMAGATDREEVVPFLENAGDTDPSPACRSNAWTALGRRRAKGLESLLKAAERYADDEHVLPGVISGLVDSGEDQAIPAIVKATGPKAHFWVRRRATKALGEINTKRTDGMRYAATARRLEELLTDPVFAVRMDASNALKDAGDLASADALEKAAKAEIDPRAKKAMGRTAAVLRAKK